MKLVIMTALMALPILSPIPVLSKSAISPCIEVGNRDTAGDCIPWISTAGNLQGGDHSLNQTPGTAYFGAYLYNYNEEPEGSAGHTMKLESSANRTSPLHRQVFLAASDTQIQVHKNLTATLTVKQDGSGNFISIQNAIAAATNGDIILVHPGVYVENVDFIGKSLTVCSLEVLEGDRTYVQSTIIDGNRASPCVSFISGNLEATLRGFTLRNGLGSFMYDDIEAWGGGIFMSQTGRVNLTNCDITDNLAALGAGISCDGGPLYLSGVNIFGNYASCRAAGLLIMGDYAQNSMAYFDPDNLCSIYSNFASSPVDILIVDLRASLEINLDLFTLDYPNKFYVQRLMNIPQYDYYTDTVNIQRGYRSEVNHDLFVSPDGDDANSGISADQAMKTIAHALYRIEADSLNIKTVHVLPGTYREGAGEQLFPLPLKSNVNLVGAGSEQTILIADSELPPIVRLIMVGQGLKNSSLRGFTLLSENEERNFPLVLQGASINVKVSDIVIRDMKVIDWGAVNIMDWISSDIDSLWMENITTDEIAFYAMNIESGTISNCHFKNINSLFSTPDPIFNGRAMIDIWVSDSVSMKNCEFRDLAVVDDQTLFHISSRNPPSYGPVYVDVNNCLFTGLRTIEVSAIAFLTHNLGRYTLSNCSFYDNYGTYAAVAVTGHISMRNNIFYNPDAPKEIHVYQGNLSQMFYSRLNFDYNLIRGGFTSINKPGTLSVLEWGTHNLSQEPAFASTEITDLNFLQLSPESPCINAGTPDITELGLLAYDLAGNWRVWNDCIDLGCFEYGSQPWVSNDDPVAPELPEFSFTAYPNPFAAIVNIRANLSFRLSGKLEDPKIKIYNLKGQLVRELSLDSTKTDEQALQWDARDADGRSCANGIYLLKLQNSGRCLGTKKISLVK